MDPSWYPRGKPSAPHDRRQATKPWGDDSGPVVLSQCQLIPVRKAAAPDDESKWCYVESDDSEGIHPNGDVNDSAGLEIEVPFERQVICDCKTVITICARDRSHEVVIIQPGMLGLDKNITVNVSKDGSLAIIRDGKTILVPAEEIGSDRSRGADSGLRCELNCPNCLEFINGVNIYESHNQFDTAKRQQSQKKTEATENRQEPTKVLVCETQSPDHGQAGAQPSMHCEHSNASKTSSPGQFLVHRSSVEASHFGRREMTDRNSAALNIFPGRPFLEDGHKSGDNFEFTQKIDVNRYVRVAGLPSKELSQDVVSNDSKACNIESIWEEETSVADGFTATSAAGTGDGNEGDSFCDLPFRERLKMDLGVKSKRYEVENFSDVDEDDDSPDIENLIAEDVADGDDISWKYGLSVNIRQSKSANKKTMDLLTLEGGLQEIEVDNSYITGDIKKAMVLRFHVDENNEGMVKTTKVSTSSNGCSLKLRHNKCLEVRLPALVAYSKTREQLDIFGVKLWTDYIGFVEMTGDECKKWATKKQLSPGSLFAPLRLLSVLFKAEMAGNKFLHPSTFQVIGIEPVMEENESPVTQPHPLLWPWRCHRYDDLTVVKGDDVDELVLQSKAKPEVKVWCKHERSLIDCVNDIAKCNIVALVAPRFVDGQHSGFTAVIAGPMQVVLSKTDSRLLNYPPRTLGFDYKSKELSTKFVDKCWLPRDSRAKPRRLSD